MLLVETYVAPSPIHGLGLFAARPIAKNTVVWEFREGFDLIVPGHLVDKLPGPAKSHMEVYGLKTQSGDYLLTPDNARFVNHSSIPNLITGHGTSPSLAIRYIAADEELTEDYAQYGEPS